MNRKADGGLTAIVIILIIIVFIGWMIRVNSRECNSNSDCKKDQYCGSDFACHEIPVKTVYKQSLTLPVLFICITIIALTVIFKWDKLFRRKEKIGIETPKETPESYYTSQFQYTAK